MFSLCTKVENIIIDMDSFDDSYIANQTFVKLIYDIKVKYNILLLGTEKTSFIETKIINTDISEYTSFSSFMNEYK
ncbi:hypothetical protein, partial [Bacillus timonensis]|uniref:hypothetical protein n=1 Tax=Bacillus timonensis TaxID=1033734 RepID=UPI001A94A88F